MGLSIYVHIPYCIQRCRYCDFTTFEASELMPPEQYVDLVLNEIRQRHSGVHSRRVDTIYFGGGTPSLIPAELIVAIIAELANVGFVRHPEAEVTIEINPATLDAQKIATYLQAGVNRFSVGAQTFNDRLLQVCGRRHSADDTRETLRLLQQHGANYSFDLLFALPGQTRADLVSDLAEVCEFAPPHLSAYCLTVPQGHPMAVGRPKDRAQIEMFQLIEKTLVGVGLQKYEISNFAKPGFESRHNMAYWDDREYWGLGLSAHSYLHGAEFPFGVRFWNPQTFEAYERQIQQILPAGQPPYLFLPPAQREFLKEHEAITDFCHIHLRTSVGLDLTALQNKFGVGVSLMLKGRLEKMAARGLLEMLDHRFALTHSGELLSNLVFGELTTLPEELAQWRLKATSPLPECPSIA